MNPGYGVQCEINRTRRSITSGGFTLIELIVVLVIVGIAAGVAIPTLSNLQSTRSAMAARQIVRDLTYARQSALAKGVTHWVVFNTGARSWSVMAEDRANPGRANATIIADSATGKTYVCTLTAAEYANVTFTSCNFNNATEIGFDWAGKPLQSNGSVLTAQGSVVLSGGQRVLVEVGTGYIRYVP